MKPDAISSPGLLPNANRLRQEIVKAVGYIEVQEGLLGFSPTQGAELDAFLSEVKAYLVSSGCVGVSSVPK